MFLFSNSSAEESVSGGKEGCEQTGEGREGLQRGEAERLSRAMGEEVSPDKIRTLRPSPPASVNPVQIDFCKSTQKCS